MKRRTSGLRGVRMPAPRRRGPLQVRPGSAGGVGRGFSCGGTWFGWPPFMAQRFGAQPDDRGAYQVKRHPQQHGSHQASGPTLSPKASPAAGMIIQVPTNLAARSLKRTRPPMPMTATAESRFWWTTRSAASKTAVRSSSGTPTRSPEAPTLEAEPQGYEQHCGRGHKHLTARNAHPAQQHAPWPLCAQHCAALSANQGDWPLSSPRRQRGRRTVPGPDRGVVNSLWATRPNARNRPDAAEKCQRWPLVAVEAAENG